MHKPVDTALIQTSHPEAWYAEKLAEIDGVNLKFRVMRDTAANFHVHTHSPECFFVLSGEVTIDSESGSVTLKAGQFLRVDPGVSHRASVVGEATLLVFEKLAG